MSQKRSRSWRKIAVAGDEFRWRYGRGTIEVRWGREVILRETDHVLAGGNPDDFERGQWKRTRAGMVTPNMVETAIRKKLGFPIKEKARPRIHLWAGSIGG